MERYPLYGARGRAGLGHERPGCRHSRGHGAVLAPCAAGSARRRHYAGGADAARRRPRAASSLGHGPTPVRELTRLGADRGRAPVWIKDDGAYSDFGGNKARKLEWLLAARRRRGKRTVLTGGALGTNHGLATARFAGRLGMRTVLILVPQPDSAHVRAPAPADPGHGRRASLRAAACCRSYLLGAGARCGGRARRSPPVLRAPRWIGAAGLRWIRRGGGELRDQVEAGELPAPSHVVVAARQRRNGRGLAAGMKLFGLARAWSACSSTT